MLTMSDHHNIIGIIPARFGSVRFPGKPLADISGKIMIRRVVEQASKVLDKVYVATDDKRILSAVNKFGGMAVMTSRNHTNGTERCAEALQIVEKDIGEQIDVVVNIQGDEPFVHPDQITLVTSCFGNRSVQIATLVKQIETENELFDLNKPKVIVNNRSEAVYFSRSPVPFIRGKDRTEWVQAHKYYRHIGLYGYRRNVLLELAQLKQSSLEVVESLEQLRWIENGYCIHVRITEHESFGVDTPEDINRITGHFG